MPQHRKPEAPSKGSECFVSDTLRTFMGSDVSTLWVRKSHPFAQTLIPEMTLSLQTLDPASDPKDLRF